MRRALIVLASFLVIALCPASFAQGCSGWMTAHYSAYWNLSAANMTQTSYTMYTSSVLDGYTSGTCPTIGCGINCNGVYHHGWVPASIKNHNTGALVGSASTTGPLVCWSCYISVTSPLDITGVPGVLYDYSASNYVICSLAGTFYTALFSFSTGVGITNYQWNGYPPSGNACQYNKQCPIPTVASCGVGTIYEAAQGGGCGPTYRWLYFLYYKTGGGTHCFPVGLVVESNIPHGCD
jgi:hypothetical protein